MLIPRSVHQFLQSDLMVEVGVLVWSGCRIKFPHIHPLWTPSDHIFLSTLNCSSPCCSCSLPVCRPPATTTVSSVFVPVNICCVYLLRQQACSQLSADSCATCWSMRCGVSLVAALGHFELMLIYWEAVETVMRWTSPVVRPLRLQQQQWTRHQMDSQHVHSVSEGVQSILELLRWDDIIMFKKVSKALFTVTSDFCPPAGSGPRAADWRLCSARGYLRCCVQAGCGCVCCVTTQFTETHVCQRRENH